MRARPTVGLMSSVRRARSDDLDDLVRLETALFVEDAGVYEEFADTSWPEREGRDDFRRLIESSKCLVLVAEEVGGVVGFLAGYTAPSSPTRQPVEYAVLRSLYVTSGQRRRGAAQLLIDEFLAWAIANDCVEAHVDSYAANVGAQALYERNGFAVRSISRVHRL